MEDFLLLQGLKGSGKTSRLIELLIYMSKQHGGKSLYLSTQPHIINSRLQNNFPNLNVDVIEYSRDTFLDLPDLLPQYKSIFIDDVPIGEFAMRVLLQIVWDNEVPICISVTPSRFYYTPFHEEREVYLTPDGVYQFMVHLRQIEDGFMLMRNDYVFLPNYGRLH